jgi:hypothetical protein
VKNFHWCPTVNASSRIFVLAKVDSLKGIVDTIM